MLKDFLLIFLHLFSMCFYLCLTLSFSVFSFQGAVGHFRDHWRLRDSNSRPPACKAGALPTEFPHSEISGSIGYLLLPKAFRSLSRPSSASGAKAFPLCSYLLDRPNLLLSLKLLVEFVALLALRDKKRN